MPETIIELPLQTPFFEKDKAVFPPIIPAMPWLDMFLETVRQLNVLVAAGGGTITIQVNGVDVGSQPNLNFIDFTVTDDAINDRVDVEMNLAQSPDFWALK